MYVCLYVKYSYSCNILMKLEFSRQIFEKYCNISKVKLKLTLEQTMKTQKGRRAVAILYL